MALRTLLPLAPTEPDVSKLFDQYHKVIRFLNGVSVTAATITKPHTGDKVALKVEGAYGVDSYGDPFLTLPDGDRLYLGSKLRNHVDVVEPYVPEPPLYSIVRVGADRYLKFADNKFRYLSGGQQPSTLCRTWAELREFAKAQKTDVDLMVPRPLSYVPRALSKSTEYLSPSGMTTSFRIGLHGDLEFNKSSFVVSKEESIQLARDILNHHGLRA